QLTQRSQHIVGPVDVRVHRREAICETFGDETLGGEMVALVKSVLAEYVENTWIAFQTRRMQDQLLPDRGYAVEAARRVFQRDASDDSVHLVTQSQKVLRQIASVLSRNAGNEGFLSQKRISFGRAESSFSALYHD